MVNRYLLNGLKRCSRKADHNEYSTNVYKVTLAEPQLFTVKLIAVTNCALTESCTRPVSGSQYPRLNVGFGHGAEVSSCMG
jgi:hypothetical protein